MAIAPVVGGGTSTNPPGSQKAAPVAVKTGLLKKPPVCARTQAAAPPELDVTIRKVTDTNNWLHWEPCSGGLFL